MEQIQIFDAVNSKSVNVFVAEEIAARCRSDANFAAELVKQIDEQNVEEGSTIEIETVVDMDGSSDTLVEKELWSRTETLKFLKLYQKYEEKYSSNKAALWLIISKELARRNIFKSPEKCQCKWKNLIRTYKAAKERNSFNRFHYFRAVDDLMNGRQLVLSDTDSEIESCDELILASIENGKLNSKEMEKESWSRRETIKFLKIFQENKYQIDNKNCSQEQLMKYISSELSKNGINKTPGKCLIKWKNLQRSYKRILDKDKSMTIQRFKYFNEVDDLLNDRVISLENLSSDTQDESDFFEGSEGSLINSNLNIEIKEEPIDMDMVNLDSIWNREEISKCMEVYNMQKIKLEAFSDDGEFWKFISEELENAGIYKTPSECEKVCNHFEKDKRREKVPNRIENGNSGSHQSGGETQEDSDNLDRNQGQYERIIIETEDAETENSWTHDEIATLISLCAKHITSKKTKEIEESVWEKISSNVSRSGKDKSVDNCQSKWKELYSTYEDCKKLDLECENFSVFENVEEVLKQSNETQSENTSCKCHEKRLREKQRRHTERMEILKRKLDIEERKVKAFEEYVKYIKR